MMNLDILIAVAMTLAATLLMAVGVGYYIIRRITKQQAVALDEPVAEQPDTEPVISCETAYWLEEASRTNR